VTTLRAAFDWARAELRAAGLDSPELDARVLVAHAAGIAPGEVVLRADMALEPDGEARLAAALARRIAREPVARILGRREFWGLTFELGPATLVPRPETETLVEAALAHLRGRGLLAARIADLGTGTGAILLALLAELPQAFGIAVERDPSAAAAARANAARLGLAGRAVVAVGDWAAGLTPGGFDAVLSNPPYIASDELAGLDPEVAAHDPRAALDGGPDGLAAYRALLPGAIRALAPGGLLALEIGETQADDVAGLVRGAGFEDVALARDLAGRPRVVMGTTAPRRK
jgi:release factor glutamine methyltransferase